LLRRMDALAFDMLRAAIILPTRRKLCGVVTSRPVSAGALGSAHLGLGGSRIDDGGAVELAEALAANYALKEAW